MDYHLEEAGISVINKIDIRPYLHDASNTCPKTVIGKQSFCHKGRENGITQDCTTIFYFFNSKIIGEMPWTKDFYTIVKDKNAY